MEDSTANGHLPRELGLFSATILVIANMVGTGIFTTSGFMMEALGNPQVMLLCWMVGGLFALCGALCYGELGALYPLAGGEYVFLREGFGKWMGFLSGWISLIVGFSAPIAAASIAFAAYFFKALSLPSSPEWVVHLAGVRVITLSPVSLLAIGAILVLSLVQCHSLFLGSRVQNGLTLYKVGFLVVFIAAGFFFGEGSGTHFRTGIEPGSVFQKDFAVSLVFAAFAYSGWNAAAYLGGEIKRPKVNIPLALVTGTVFVICLYMLLNAVFVYALPPHKMSGVLEIGIESATALFGSRAGPCFGLAISLGLLSVLSAMIMAGPRVYYAMSKDGAFLKLFSRVHPVRRTPARSILLQAGIAVIMIVTASFDTLLIYIGFTLSLFAMLAVAALMRIRRKHPLDRHRYRTWGYPLTPLFFIAGNLWIIYFTIRSRPVTSLFGLGTIALGLFVYFGIRYKSVSSKNRP